MRGGARFDRRRGAGGGYAAVSRLGCEVSAVNITGGGAGDAVGQRVERAEAGPYGWGAGTSGAAGIENCAEVDGGWSADEGADKRANDGGRLRMGADGPGEHDDLVMALALACWRAKRRQNEFGTRRLPGI